MSNSLLLVILHIATLILLALSIGSVHPAISMVVMAISFAVGAIASSSITSGESRQ